MGKRILYLMHISWGWVKQRPHFIAEGLNEKNDVTVVAKCDFRNNIVRNSTNLKVYSLLRLPLERYLLIRKINSLLYKIQLHFYCRSKDVIWFTAPFMTPYVQAKGKLVFYDCMDDILEFPDMKKNSYLFNETRKCEENLYRRANFVFASSLNLKNKLIERYGEREIFVINNGINMPQFDENLVLPKELTPLVSTKTKKIVYIGTISSWMDFNLLRKIKEMLPLEVNIFLFGPTEVDISNNDYFIYCGVIEHKFVFEVMKHADVLIMPFLVTDLIKSVNPVKLYEYIYSGKDIIAPLYEESLKFKDFVHLYRDHNHCLNIVKDLCLNGIKGSKTITECYQFCLDNTWKKRIQQIDKYINA